MRLSRTFLVMIPTVSKLEAKGMSPAVGIRFLVGLSPTKPQAAAGCRTDPPVSDPIEA